MDRTTAGHEAAPPTFSVVICTFNRAEILPRAIESVLAQTFPDFELIVVDDGSTDATGDLVRAATDPRVRYVRQDNQGLSAARNAGVGASSGRYVVFLDDDDIAMPIWLERFAAATTDDPAVVCAGEVVRTDDGTVLDTRLPAPLGPAYADYSGYFLAGTFAVRRDAYDAVGGYHVGLPHLHQNEFFLRLMPACRARGWEVVTVAEPVLLRHALGDRREGVQNTRNLVVAMGYVLDEHGEQIARDPRLLAQFAAVAGVAAARTGDFRSARRYLRRAVHAQPRAAKHWARLALAYVSPAGRVVWNRPTTRPSAG
jgi:glycosyltransferase involved in cell wall biosynthesis